MIPNIDRQDEVMRAVWPAFEKVRQAGDFAEWQGPVRPLLQTYRISILYRVPLLVELLDAGLHQPQVSVLTPQLRPRPGDPEGQLPHVYYCPSGVVAMCLLDPEADDWSPADFIAETTVPWAIEWLAAYEGWRATGKWTASGRHVENVRG